MQITRNENGDYIVPSESKEGETYIVSEDLKGCNCPAFAHKVEVIRRESTDVVRHSRTIRSVETGRPVPSPKNNTDVRDRSCQIRNDRSVLARTAPR